MALAVHITNFGVQVNHIAKKTSITIPPDAWQNLIACQEQVTSSINGKTEASWPLTQDLRVSTSLFNNHIYVHIRHWFKNHPTRKGLSLFEKEWPEMCEHLIEGSEMKLARKVMLEMMKTEITKMIHKKCEGCLKGYPSQTDHDCLMNGFDTAKAAADDVTIKPEDFIAKLAGAALQQSVILETLYDSYKRVKLFDMDKIKQSIVNDYVY